LKKCIPTTRLGFVVATAISVTGSEEDRVGADDLVEAGEHRLLQLQALRYGLDDQVDIGEVREVGRVAHAGVQRVVGRLVHLPPVQAPPGAGGEHAAAPLDGGVVDLDGDDVDAATGEDLDDSGTHRAQADHTDGGEVTSHGPILAEPSGR
jgi:hypothetical protein